MAEPEAGGSRWGVILLAVAGGIVIAFQIGKMPASIPALERDLGFGLVGAGWAISLLYGVAAVTGVAAGAFADRIGVRRVAAAGLICAAAGSLLGGLSGGLWTLLASRLVEGFGAVAMLVTAPALIYRAVAPRDMRLAMALWGTFMPTGIAIMLVLTPVLLSTIGWRGMWFANAAVVAGFAVWLWFGTAATPDPPRETGPRRRLASDVGEVLRRAGPWLLALCFAFYAASYLCITAFLPKYLIEERGWAADPAAVATAVVIAANAAGNMAGGGLAQKGVPRWMLMAIGIGTMGVTAWFVYQPWVGDVACIAVAIVFSLVGGFLPASVFASAPIHAPRRGKVAGVNGLILQGTNMGQLCGPPLFAAIVAATRWETGPFLVIAMAAVGLVLAALLGRLERRGGRATPA